MILLFSVAPHNNPSLTVAYLELTDHRIPIPLRLPHFRCATDEARKIPTTSTPTCSCTTAQPWCPRTKCMKAPGTNRVGTAAAGSSAPAPPWHHPQSSAAVLGPPRVHRRSTRCGPLQERSPPSPVLSMPPVHGRADKRGPITPSTSSAQVLLPVDISPASLAIRLEGFLSPSRVDAV
uniref:Uncharacterized protein n=1 Tax=Arundo donax TaxID=35708 RepID=A0A0A9GQC4_ARUDO